MELVVLYIGVVDVYQYVYMWCIGLVVDVGKIIDLVLRVVEGLIGNGVNDI